MTRRARRSSVPPLAWAAAGLGAVALVLLLVVLADDPGTDVDAPGGRRVGGTPRTTRPPTLPAPEDDVEPLLARADLPPAVPPLEDAPPPPRAVTVLGRVVSAAYRPVQGARVAAARDARDEPVVAVTDGEGAFEVRLDLGTEGGSLWLVATHDEQGSGVRRLPAVPGELGPIEIVVPHPARIEGVVVDAGGLPLQGVEVGLVGWSCGPDFGSGPLPRSLTVRCRDTSDEGGRFTLQGVPRGEGWLAFARGGVAFDERT